MPSSVTKTQSRCPCKRDLRMRCLVRPICDLCSSSIFMKLIFVCVYFFLPDRKYALAFSLNFSRWMCRHPELYRMHANMNLSELTVKGEQIIKGARVLVSECLCVSLDFSRPGLTLPVSAYLHCLSFKHPPVYRFSSFLEIPC